jgi:branched-chain amino acid transport system ATP-binding protein
VGLQGAGSRTASTLSHGELRQLELGLALAASPRLLLLDEPTAGLSLAERDRLTLLIQKLPRTMTLLIVEHDMDVVLQVADRVSVLHLGQVIAEGSPAEVSREPAVQRAYLGNASGMS